MRNISATSLAILQQTSGVEPVIVVRVWWGGSPTNYCDRKFAAEGLVGKLLQIGGIEDIVDINANASSVSLDVLLDDSDGSIKAIYDNVDIHKTYVQILQWFNGIPFSEAFSIFEGEISSPIVWSEGARTLSFQVVTQLEATEVGFSAEEGQFAFLPDNLVGKPWPIIFGTVAGSPLLSITEPASCILASGFGIVDHDIWEAELDDMAASIAKLWQQARETKQLGINNAIIAGAYKPFGGDLPDDPALAEQYDNAAQQYYAQAEEFAQQAVQLQAELNAKYQEYDLQKAYEFRVLPITATNLPVGVQLPVELGNYTATATVIGSQIVLTALREKRNVNERVGANEFSFGENVDQFKRTSTGNKFTWIDGGTQVKVFNLPKYYIASLGAVNVLNVWAQSKYGRAVVPRNWYVVEYVPYGNLLATRIVFPTPITSYPGEWQDGQIEIDAVSALSSNVVDIMTWAIQNFSTLPVDSASFNDVRGKVDRFRANFVLTQRKNIIQFLQEVAFQARCAIWINDRRFFLRFLPEELPPVETITDSDVEVDSLTITSTDTERLVTKFVANWRSRFGQSEPNKIIYRYNAIKYGIVEEEFDFYIYSDYTSVAVAAQFWLIRKSSTWKRISCKVLLHKLRIETFDPVQFSFNEPLVAYEPVTGIIEKATYNPDDDVIELEAWLPVRLGEMHKYQYAFPFTVQNIYPNVADPNIRTGNPFDGATGIIAPRLSFPPYQQVTTLRGNPYTQGMGQVIADSAVQVDPNVVVALDAREINQNRPPNINDFNNTTRYQVRPITPISLRQSTPASFYGVVVAKETSDSNLQVYKVSVFFNGLTNNGTITPVTIPKLAEGSELPEGYPLTVNRIVWTDRNGRPNIEYFAQPPIWFKLEESDAGNSTP